MSHFKLTNETRASGVIPVRKYVSARTGLTVIIAGVEGPVVHGYFCLATEAHDDDGLPHTLEHLIFLGSKRYPFKGILDLLANRCLAAGTNAWTDTDHTCYTVSTAGAEGMLTLLPIYLDHVLHPTLTEEGFVTEVHHVNGEGEDAGVVYCEMQGCENTADSRCRESLLSAFYPNNGYSANTGGVMKNLRESTNNVKVREFHKKFYHAENLCVILTGQIEPEDVFKAIEVVEDDILANKEMSKRVDNWVRPWQSDVPEPNYGTLKVQWPADVEDCGQVIFAWKGPHLKETDSLKTLAACAQMLLYLCDTPTSPLQQHLVEKEDALAGDVSYNIIENMSSLIQVCVDNIPLDKLQKAHDEALTVIKNIRSGTEAIDMERMRRLVKKELRKNLASLESNPHEAVAFHCIGDMLYSNSDQDFLIRLNSDILLKDLLEQPSDYWVKLLQKYFTDNTVTVIGSPSIELQAKMAMKEKDRIEAQRKALGEEGLAKKEKIFKDAIVFNEREPPVGTLAQVPIPSCSNLKCYDISTWMTDSKPCQYFELDAVPLFTRLHHIHTNLIYLNLVFDLTNTDRTTRKWLTTIVSLWGECPIQRNGELVPYEKVVAELEEISVRHGKQIGFGKAGNFAIGNFGNHAYFDITVEPSEYEKAVQLLWEVFFAAHITKERLLVVAQRLINDVAQVRRKGNKMAYDILQDALYSDDSNVHWNTVLRQHKFLTELVEHLNGASCESVLAEAEAAYRTISDRLWLHMATDLHRNKLSAEPWRRFRRQNEIVVRPPQLVMDYKNMRPAVGGCVVGVGGVESNYLVQTCPGPDTYAPEKIAPLLLLLNYFTQLEGPMWRLIRGCGLSYGYGVRPGCSEARLYFSLFKSTNVVEAYCKAKSIVEEYLASEGQFDSDLFVSARSSAIFEVVEDEKSPSHLAQQSLCNYLRRVDEKYNRDLVRALSLVTEDQAREAGRWWLPKLFDVALTYTTVVCHPAKVEDTRSAFQKIGLDLKAFESIESSHFNK